MKRILSMFLAAVMVMSLVPMAVFAETTSALEINGLGGDDILVGRAVEFTVTSLAATEDVGKTVICHYEIDAEESDIEKLEYYEEAAGMEGWYDFPSKISGAFGPTAGFPYFDGAESSFRVTFAKAGTYSVTLSADLADGTGTVCTKTFDVEVREPVASEMTTDIEEKDFVVGNAVEFDVSTIPNDYAGILVKGTYSITANEEDIAKLEYYETATGMEGWYEFPSKLSGTFGPVTGFPMMNATSKFRVTFANAGDYSVELAAVAVDGGAVLCSKNVDVEVLAYADYTTLNATIATAQDCVDNEAKYTTATIADVKTALEAAKAVVDANYTEKDQSVVDNANDELVAAIDALLLLADTSDIEALIATATTEIETNYTKATWAPFKAALDAANELLENELSENDQTDVDDAKAALEEAMNALKKVADTAALKAKVGEADALDENIYSTVTFGAMIEKLDAAKALLDEDLSYVDDQTRVDTALDELTTAVANLKKLVAVSVSATAVASDVTAEYGKADTIVLVFGTALDCNESDVLDAISIIDDVAFAEWVDTYQTVLKLTLVDNYSLTNGAVIAFEESEAVVDTNGNVVSEMTVAVVGNLEDVSEEITANTMTATIVKGSAKPGVNADDKIVLVFNAPVKNTPAEIDITSDASSVVMKAAKDDTMATVYVISNIDADLVDSSKLTFADIADVTLLGSFGTAVAPVVTKVLAVENSNNALTVNEELSLNDEIVIYFSRPTNGVAISSDDIENALGIADATADWSENNTVLTITLGSDSVVANGMTINLDGLGIMDEYEMIDYVALDLALEGAFITAKAPVVERILIVDNNGTAKTEGDNIIISFNTPINEIDLSVDNIKKIVAKAGQGLGDDFDVSINDARTEIIIEVGATATLDDTVLFNLKDLGITDKDGLHNYEGVVIAPEGSFGTSIAPKITRAIAFTQGTKHIIRVFFNTEVEVKGAMSVTIDNGFDEGTNFSEKWTDNGITYYDLILGDDHSEFVTGVNTITFNGVIADKESGKTSDDVSAIINGGFEQDIEPEILSLTAYSKDGSGVAKIGDKIVLVLNSKVTKLDTEYDFVSTDNVTWTYTLTSNNEIGIGDEIEFEIEAQGKDYTKSATVAGSFGYKVEPKLLSAVAYSKDGSGIAKAGDEIILTFNSPVSGVASTLGTVTTTDNMTFVIALAADDSVSVGDELAFDVTSIATGEGYNFKVNLAGSFGKEIEPNLISVTAYSKDGSGVAKRGDSIVVVFNTPVSDVETTLGNVTTNDNVVWTITLTDDNVAIGDSIDFDVTSIATNKAYTLSSTIKGSFGYKAEAKLLSATIYSADGSGIAKAGDKIVLVFNMPVEGVESDLGNTATTDKFVWTITLDSDNSVNVGDSLTFDDVTDVATNTEYDFEIKLAGNLGIVVEPKLISVTAYSKDGSGIAKVGDSIVVVFNTPVKGVESTLGTVSTTDNTIWTITLTDANVKVGDPIEFDVTSIATNKAYTLSSAIKGNFGYKAEAKLLSATIYSADGSGVAKKGDKIVLVFNMPVEGVTSNLGSVETTDKSVWTITLAADNSINVGAELKFNDVTDVATGTAYRFETYLAGNLGLVVEPELISATAYSKDGSGVAKVGDEIVLVFNAPVDGVTSMYGDATTTDKTVWTISIENTNIRIGETLSFNVTSIANGTTKNCFAALEGSFGKIVEPKSLSITAISNDGSGVAKAGDKIVVVFNTAVTVKKINNVAVTEGTGNVYTYTLKADNEFKVGDEFILTVVSADNGKEYTLNTAEDKTTIGGSFGYSEMPTVKSVVLSETSGIETITVVFDRATNKPSIDTSILKTNNEHLAPETAVIPSAIWENDTVLKITLAANATTTDASKLNLSGLGIKAQDTGAEITGINELAITGTLVPVVQSVNASGKVIAITFSTRTNGVANISNLVTLLGAGAKAEWSENNKVLTITLGESYTITNNGYIVLNGMGIKDGFSGTHHVVGQYKVSGSIETDTLAVTKIVAQSTDKSKTTAQKGDTIVVKFNSATNLNGAELNTIIESADVDAIISVDGGNEAAFGTGYTGMWTAYDTLVITLGGKTLDTTVDPAVETGVDPTIAVGTDITVSSVAFANGEGTMNTTALELAGSFNGREFVITDGKIERTSSNNNGDYRISMNVENTLLNTSVKPTIVCVAYNGSSAVSVTRITIDIADEATPIFELSGNLKVTSAKIYVFSDAFANITASPEVLAEPIEIK